MTNKSKLKGSNFERELVNQFKKAGFEAKRAYASNGKSLGLAEEVDILVTLPGIEASQEIDENTKTIYVIEEVPERKFKIQAKRRKKFPKSLIGLTKEVDASIVREDNGESFIILRLNDFIQRFLN